MFKPLLKTIPSLSGNMKIVCPLEGYIKKIGHANEFDCVVNSAYLNTISSTLFDKNIKLNLRNGSYEYDVSRFYKYYSNIFYKNCFNYSQINIPILDETSTIYQSNTDFQFGCKRVSYIKSKNVFAFFAPIYIEGINDIKNKVFKIKCEYIFETNRITKYINIPISKIFDKNDDEIKNYLGDYLERYSEKIDDDVIYFSKSYKNIYYGIDLNNGGFVDIEDNISKNLFNKYYTINDFDCIINKGFSRNSLLIKQILALSFYFDPEKLLNNNEKKFYKNTKLYISGRWYNGDNPVDFYNFSDNYHRYSENIYKLDHNGAFRLSNTINNIMDVKYPAFNEASSTNYKYINTVAKNYNRWKLKYSTDEFPYIINNNYAFSFNQDSLYMYKEFPLRYNPLTAICTLKEGSKYNMLIDFNNIYNTKNFNVLNNPKNYYDVYDKFYISNFFNVIVKNDNSDDYLNIFDSNYSGFWADVNKDGKVYYKGILYDLNNIYKSNSLIDDSLKIDKFSVFVEPHFTYQNIYEYNSLYKYANVVSNIAYEYSYNYLSNDFYDYYNNFSQEIRNNILVKKVNRYKKFIKINNSSIEGYKVLKYYAKDYFAKGFSLKSKYYSEYSDNQTYYWYSGYKDINNSTDEQNIEKIFKQKNIISNGTIGWHILTDNNITVLETGLLYNELTDENINWYWYVIIPTIFDLEINPLILLGPAYINYESLLLDTYIRIDNNIEYKVYKFRPSQPINIKFNKRNYYWYVGLNIPNSIDNLQTKQNTLGWHKINTSLNRCNIIFDNKNKINLSTSNNNVENEYYIVIPNNDNIFIYSEDGNTLLEDVFIDDVNEKDQKYYYDLHDIYDYLIEPDEGKTKYLYDINLYYDLNDIYMLMYDYLNKSDLSNLDRKNIEEYIDFESLNIRHDYKILECYNIKNIYGDNFKTEENNYSKLIYRENKFLEYDSIYWAKDKLYFSIYPNNTKYSLLTQYNLFEENIDSNIILYLKSDFIKVEDIDPLLDNLTNYLYNDEKIFKDISKFKNLDKYYYINGLYNKKDKKVYTLPVFKQLNGFDNNYGKIYSGNTDNNVIYIDPYNLSKVYTSLSKTFNINSSFEVTEEKYCRFLNNSHIYYYIDKLYKNHENQYDFNINTSLEDAISDTIYIRIRYFNNIRIGENSPYSTIILKDEYIKIRDIKIKEYIIKEDGTYEENGIINNIKDVGQLLNNSQYDEEFKYWTFNEQINQDNILYRYYYGNKQLKSFEIFFKKKMFKLNKDLYNVILSLNDTDSYKDLYLYHLETSNDYKLSFNYNIISNHDEFNSELLKNNLNEALYPYFNMIWEENRSLTKIYSDYFINNISESIDENNYSYYRYNVAPLNMLVYSKEKLYKPIVNENIQPEELDKYIIVNGEKDNFCSNELIDKFKCTENELNVYDNLCTYSYNGINYGFYYINTYFSNTLTYLNLISEDMNYIDYVNYINDIDISLLNKYSYSYLMPTYKNILPYMNNNNITKFLINNSNILIKPTSNKLDNIYKQYPNYDKETLISYTIYNIKKHKPLELTRYFDNIVPYIKKESSVTSYYLYFKKTNKYIENSKILNNEPYIMYEETSSIYKYVPVSYFYTYMDNNVEIIGEEKYTPTEYKYYNFNMYYNLEKHFEIDVLDENKESKKFNEKEMISFENNQEEILKLFTNYIKKYEDLTRSDILFLYKKYKVDFNHNFIGLEKKTYNRLYQIKIEFSLL